MIDTSQLREDYRNGLSVRAIAAKYDIPKSTVGWYVKKYGWTQEAKVKRICKKQDTDDRGNLDGLDKLDKPASRSDGPEISLEDYTVLREYVLKILAKADQLLEIDDALAPRDLKSLTSMLMDARVLLGALSPAEKREQELKLANLEKTADEGKDDDGGTAVMFYDTEGAEE